MRRLLKAILLVPIAIVVALFAIANRQGVRVSLDPFSRELPQWSFEIPLFAVVLACVAAGIVIGGLASWIVQGKHRKARRRLSREADRLRMEAETLRANVRDSALTALPARRG